MRIGLDDTLYLVTDPGSHSTMPDVLSEVTLRGLMRQIAGGLDENANPVLYTDQNDAHGDAANRLLARRAADWIREQRGYPAEEVVRITLHGEDGEVLFQGDVR